MRRQPRTPKDTPAEDPSMISHQAPRNENTPRISVWKTIGILLLAVFVIMFILNYLLPTMGIGGCIGVIRINGEIMTGTGYGIVSSDETISFINQAESRPDVKGILVMINSPGGSPVASKDIYEALKESEKPVVAYIDETGASGAYYVALGADTIIANPISITGSIGVRATQYDLSPLLEKIGINATVIKSGSMKDIGDVYRPMTDEEKELMQSIVSELQADFNSTVISQRSNNSRFSIEGFRNVSDARVLTGRQAYELGLVDNIGTKRHATAMFGESLGLGGNPSLCYFVSEQGMLESLLSSIGRGVGEALSKSINTGAARVEYK